MVKLSRRGRKILVIISLVLLAISFTAFTTRAFEGRSGDVVIIQADEVIGDDLYVAADEFTLNGTVKGDLIVVGRTVEINGVVEGDLIAGGQSVIINGTVGDDARIAGYALTIGGKLADDLIAAGFSLEDKSGSSVGGDLVFVGYQALLAGAVAEDVHVAGGAVELAGAVGGNAAVDVSGAEPGEKMPPGFPFYPGLPTVPSASPGLMVDEVARIAGDLQYTANVEANIPSGVVAGRTDFTQYVPKVEPAAETAAPTPAAHTGIWFAGQLRHLVTLLLVGAVMMWLVPGWTRKIARIVQTRPLPSLGWGVVAIAAFILAMLALIIVTVLLVTIFGVATLGALAGQLAMLGGLALGATGFGFSLVWTYVTRIAISLLLGQLIFRLFKSPAAEHRWWPMLLGVLIFVIITAVPVLRWLVMLATVLLGLGAVWQWGRDRLRSRKAAPVAEETLSQVTPN